MKKIQKTLLPYKVIIAFLMVIIIGSAGVAVKASPLTENILDRVAEKIANAILGDFEDEALAELNVPDEEPTLGISTRDEIWLNNDSGVIYFGKDQDVGIRISSGVLQCDNTTAGTWGACSGGTPGDEGWLADGANEFMYPATNARGDHYPIVLGATGTSSPATADTELQIRGGGGLVVDGTLDVIGNVSLNGGTFIFNEDSADKDFRVESNGDAYMLMVDASSDRVGIGEQTPTYTLDVGGSISGDDYFYHNGDTDSYIGFDGADVFTLQVGGEEMIDITEDGSQDIFEIGDGGDLDIDFNDMAHITGSNGFFAIGDDTTADTMLEVVDTTAPQVTIAHTDTVDYYTIDVDSDGDVTIIASGGEIDWSNINLSTTGNFSAANYTVTGTLTGTGDLIWDTNTLYVDVSANSVSIGTTTSTASLSVLNASNPQLRLSYDADNFIDYTVGSGGDLVIAASGGDISFSNENLVTTGTLGAAATTLSSTLTVTDDLIVDTDTLFVDNSTDRVGISSSSPSATFSVGTSGTATTTMDFSKTCIRMTAEDSVVYWCRVATGGTFTCSTSSCE